MTKKLFAIVLAAVLAIAMFTFPVLADDDTTTGTGLVYDSSAKTLTAYWQASSESGIVRYDLTLYRDGETVKTGYVTNMSSLKYTFTGITTGGDYTVVIQAKQSNSSTAIAVGSSVSYTYSVPTTSSSGSGSSKITITYENNTLKADWTAQTNANNYQIVYGVKSGTSTAYYTVTTNGNSVTYTFSSGLTYSNLLSVKVYVGYSGGGYSGTAFASWTNSSSSSSSSSSTSGSVSVTGNVQASISNNYLNVAITDYTYTYYRYAVITSSTTSPTYTNLGYTRSFSVPVYNLYYSSSIGVIVEGSYNNSTWASVGYVNVLGYYYSSSSTGSYGVQLTTSNGAVIASWSAVSNALGYYVSCTTSSGTTSTLSSGYNYCQLPFSTTDTGWSVTVYALTSDYQTVYVGSAYASSLTGSTSTSTSTSGITSTQIKNLTVTPVSTISTTLSWSKYTGASYYYILYGGLNDSNLSETFAYNTSVSIPYGSNTDFQAIVYAMDSNGTRIATVGYVYYVHGTTASTGSTSTSTTSTTGKTYPTNLTAKSSNKKITLSWKAAEGATSYTIYYKRSTSSSWIKINATVTKTTVNINGLTNDIKYDFKVVPNKGTESSVVSIAPSASTSKTVTATDPSSSGDGDVDVDDNVLTITSVSSSTKGKISVSWTDVGAASYKIYIAEGTSTTYKPCGTYTGTSATISTFGTGSSATSFTSGTTYKVRIIRTDYTGTITEALKACAYKTVTVK